MFTTRWRLFRLLGFPIYIDASWLIILALVTWAFASDLAQRVPGMAPGVRVGLALLTALVYFLCIVLHELGHSVVARGYGMPIRGITLFVFGGVSELSEEPATARSEFLMAIAGPAVSAALAGIFYGLWRAGLAGGWNPAAEYVLWQLWFINFVVLLFNLVPAFPLDGGRVLRSALWASMGSLRRATRWASSLGVAFAWVLIAWGVIEGFYFGHLFGGLFLGFIGMFLMNAARSSYQQVLIRQTLQGEPVGRFMNREPITVTPSLDLRSWVEHYVYRYHRKAFPVVLDGKLEGIITTAALAHYPRDAWPQHTVGEAMRRDVRPVSVPPRADALAALGRMQATGSSRLLVVEGDHLAGIVSLKDLLRFLHLKLELEDHRDDGTPPDGVRAPG